MMDITKAKDKFEKYVEDMERDGFKLDKLDDYIHERTSLLATINYVLLDTTPEKDKELVAKCISEIIALSKDAALIGFVAGMINDKGDDANE